MATLQIHVRLVQMLAERHASRYHQRIQAHRTLRPARIDLVHQLLQIALRRRTLQTGCRSPQQRRSAQIDQRAVLQDVRLVEHGLALLLCGARLAQAEHIAADAALAPAAAFAGAAAELAQRMHDEHAVGGQTVDLDVVLPFGRLFLRCDWCKWVTLLGGTANIWDEKKTNRRLENTNRNGKRMKDEEGRERDRDTNETKFKMDQTV